METSSGQQSAQALCRGHAKHESPFFAYTLAKKKYLPHTKESFFGECQHRTWLELKGVLGTMQASSSFPLGGHQSPGG